jgi:hypothetical protein
MVSSLITVISERRKYFRAGYRMHQTSVLGRLTAAETRKEAAAGEGSALAIWLVHVNTLTNPGVRMVQETNRCVHQLPDSRLLE